MAQKDIPLCVDLDETFLKCDVLYECCFYAFKEKPFSFLKALPLAFQDRLAFKKRIVSLANVEKRLFPVNSDVLKLCQNKWAAGQNVYLATASPRVIAEKIVKEYLIFSGFFCSDDVNLKGHEKAKTLISKFGEKGFDYIGNATVDLPIWEKARNALVVTPSKGLLKKVKKINSEVTHIDRPLKSIPTLLRAIRIHQWAKNLLIFLPLILAHKFSTENVFLSCMAFLCFSLTASSIYVLNDLADLDNDRRHIRKKNRPLAAGDFSLPQGLVTILFLLAVALGLSLFLNNNFFLVLVFYLVVTTLYSFFLKKIVLVDVLILATLYTTRIFAGSKACDIAVSSWLFTFSIFFFVSLAFLKRYTELQTSGQKGNENIVGRGYIASDIGLVSQFGVASAYTSILVLVFYLFSKDIQELYRNSTYLSLIVPLISYWIMRVWVLAHRGIMKDDPIEFALKDKTSIFLGFVTVIIFGLALI